MAHTEGTSPRLQRLTSLVATMIGRDRPSRSRSAACSSRRTRRSGCSPWAWRSAVIAWALERRSLLLATVASAPPCSIVGLGLIVFPETTWYGLPTMETLREMGRPRRPWASRRGSRSPPPLRSTPWCSPARRRVGGGVLVPRARVPGGKPAARARPAGRPCGLRRQRARARVATPVRDGVPDRRHRGRVRRLAAAPPRMGRGLAGEGSPGPAPARRGTRGEEDRRRRDRGRAGRSLIVPGFGSKAVIDLSSLNADGRIAVSPLVSIGAT